MGGEELCSQGAYTLSHGLTVQGVVQPPLRDLWGLRRAGVWGGRGLLEALQVGAPAPP